MSTGRVSRYAQTLVQRFGQGWNQFWYLPSDPIPLAVIRIATGLVGLYFLFSYSFDLVYFFGANGLLPADLYSQFRGADVFVASEYSYLTYLDNPTELYIAHGLGIAVMAMFTIGLFSRITSVLALLVTLSYVHRAPLVTSEIEPVLSMLQFYLCLGPCGAVLSADRLLASRAAAGRPEQLDTIDRSGSVGATIAIRLIQIHTCLICLMMGMAKVAGPGQLENIQQWVDPWGRGEAVWWLIGRTDSTWVDLTWLHNQTDLISAWTHAIVLFELLFPILVWNKTARPLLLGIAVFMWSLVSLINGVPTLSFLLIVASASFVSPDYLRDVFGNRQPAIEPASQAA